MNPNSCEALPGNYRQTREIDFVNLSRENIIGLLLTLVLLVGPVLLVLPSHPFTLLSSAKKYRLFPDLLPGRVPAYGRFHAPAGQAARLLPL